MNKAQAIINKLSREDFHYIGFEILQYTASVANRRAKRFIAGMCNELKNWEYDEFLNWGEMHKVIALLKYLETKGITLKDF